MTNQGVTPDQHRLHAAMTLLAGPEKAAAAVAQHQELGANGRISKAEPLPVFGGSDDD